MNPPESSEQPAAAAVTVQLPTFSPADALAWFQRAEVIFRTKRISSSTKKADYVLAALPEDIFPVLSTWLLSKEDQAITFEETKLKLLSMFSPTPEERAERLLQLSRLSLAGQRPSAAYEEMRALATLPDKRPLDLLRVLWLLRLPDSIRESLVDFMDTDISTLTSNADSRMAAARKPRPIAPATPEEDQDDSLQAAAANPTKRPVRRQQAPRQDKKLRPYCWYHARFGDAARNCIPPCTYSKNA